MLGWPEIVVIGGVLFLFFGPQRLPEVAKSVGQGIKEFKKATKEGMSELTEQSQPTPMVCPSCKATIQEEKAVFCPKCGKSLNPSPSTLN